MTKYTDIFTIRGCDINSDYKIKPSALCGYFQESFARFCTGKNLAAFDIISQDLLWVIANIHIEFADLLPFWGELIETHIWMSEVKKYRLYFDFSITCNGKTIAKGDSCWFVINAKTRKPEVVEFISKNFEIENESTFGERTRLNILPQGKPTNELIYKVGLSDLDFNQHVNNLAYVNVALTALDDNYKKEHSLKSYKVTYLKESFLHDEWIHKIYKQENTFTHSFERKQDGEMICMLQTTWQQNIKDNRDIRLVNFDIAGQSRKNLLGSN